MRYDPWLTEISPADIEAAHQRKAAREALIAEQAAEITRLRAELDTARREGMALAADLCDDLPNHQGGICAIAIRMMIDEEDKKAAIRAAAGASPGEYLTEAEQERDEFFNRLGRITEYLEIPVDATAQRIIEAIKERIDNEREACASVEVRLTVPEGAETWTPLEAWEGALLAFNEAFRDAIRAKAKKDRQT